MEDMKIDLGKIEQCTNKIVFLEKGLRNYSDRIENVSDSLEKNSSVSINLLCEKIDLQNKEVLDEVTRMDNLLVALEAIISKYSETEKRITEYKTTMGNSDNGMNQERTEMEKVLYESLISDVDDLKKKIENLKKIFKSLYKGTDDSELKVVEKVWAYLESLLDFFTGDKKGFTGWGEWFDLADSSINIWSALYDYWQKKYADMTTGLFGKIAQRNVKIAGVTAGFFALIASIFEASDGVNEKEWQNKIADYVDCGKDILTIVNADYSLKHIGDTTSLAKKKAGLWSALDIYIALGKSGIEMLSQGIRSVGEYSSDGQWDLNDTGATGIDISMAGIYAIAHNLTFGLDDLLFEKIISISGGNKPADMNYMQMAAEGYKVIASDIGKAIGNFYIKLRK